MKGRVSISGMTGFVGQNLSKYLTDSDIVCAPIDRIRIDNKAELPEFNGVTAIVHLAGKAHDLKKTSDPGAYYEANYELTKKLYDKFLVSDATKFIFISSVKAAADHIDGILDENIAPDPRTHYGKSKLMAEQYILSCKLPPGKSYYILRPCMIHGPGNKGNLNLLYKFVQKGIPYPLASFENKRSFLSIENLCFVIKELLNTDNIPSGIYNVADDEALSTSEVVSVLSYAIDKKPKLWFISKRVIRALAKIGDHIKLPLNTERLNKLTENYVVSNKKIKDTLGIRFPVETTEGLLITARSFR